VATDKPGRWERLRDRRRACDLLQAWRGRSRKIFGDAYK